MYKNSLLFQRRNLGNIAKILQFAAVKKGFGEESNYLTVLNPYIIECHEKFKRFFAECCTADDIVEPTEAFKIDQVQIKNTFSRTSQNLPAPALRLINICHLYLHKITIIF